MRARVPAFDALEPGDSRSCRRPRSRSSRRTPRRSRRSSAAARGGARSAASSSSTDPLGPTPPATIARGRRRRDRRRAGRAGRGRRRDPAAASSGARSASSSTTGRSSSARRRSSRRGSSRSRSRGGGPEELAAAIAGFLGRAVAIEGRRGTRLAVHAPADVPDAAAAVAAYHARVAGPRPPASALPLPAPDAGGRASRPAPALVLLGERPPTELERVATARVAGLLALELAREEAVGRAIETARREPLPADGPPWVVLVARQAAGEATARRRRRSGRAGRRSARRREPRGAPPRPAGARAGAPAGAPRRRPEPRAPDRGRARRGRSEAPGIAGRIGGVPRPARGRLPAVRGRRGPVGRGGRCAGDAGGGRARSPSRRAVARADRLPAYRLLGNLHNLPDGDAPGPGAARAAARGRARRASRAAGDAPGGARRSPASPRPPTRSASIATRVAYRVRPDRGRRRAGAWPIRSSGSRSPWPLRLVQDDISRTCESPQPSPTGARAAILTTTRLAAVTRAITHKTAVSRRVQRRTRSAASVVDRPRGRSTEPRRSRRPRGRGSGSSSSSSRTSSAIVKARHDPDPPAGGVASSTGPGSTAARSRASPGSPRATSTSCRTWTRSPRSRGSRGDRARAGTARVICDVYTPNGEPFAGDPRGVLRRQVERARQARLRRRTPGPELEFFLFRRGRGRRDRARCRTTRPATSTSRPTSRQEVRQDMVDALEAFGIQRRGRPPRGRGRPARDRLRVRRRAQDRRQRDHLQVHAEGDRPAARPLRDVHAQADLRHQRLGHAHPPEPVLDRRGAERVRRPETTSTACRTSPAAYMAGHPRPRPRDDRGPRPAREQLQAARPGLRGADVPDLGPDEPLRAHPRAEGLARQVDRGDPRRGPLPGPVLEHLPRVRRDDRGRPRRRREGPDAGATRSRRASSRWTRRGSRRRASASCPGTLGEAIDELEADAGHQRGARRPRPVPLRRGQAGRVGRVPHAGHEWEIDRYLETF